MSNIKIGFLPLYLQLYEDIKPWAKEPMMPHKEECIKRLKDMGAEVIAVDLCTKEEQFLAAADLFIKEDVDVIVTLHIAYSPSLKSIGAFVKMNKPVIALDATPTYDFKSSMFVKDEIFPNHGIHGVQDMCNLLRRNNIPFKVESGHIDHSDVIERVFADCQAAKAAKNLKNIRVGRVGGSFDGMGDFFKTPEELKDELGATVVPIDLDLYNKLYSEVTDEEIQAQIAYDKEAFEFYPDVNEDDYYIATKAGIALEKWIEAEKLGAYTVNFLGTGTGGIHKMPFHYICKIIAKGIGYAGEGDALTASLVGALQEVYPQTSFTEMFCPCWKTGEIFLSHMGEMNINLSSRKPKLKNCGFNWTDAGNTVQLTACLMQGEAVLVNLAPCADGKYTLILAPVEMKDFRDENGVYDTEIRGWFKPSKPIERFLEEYSNYGGTHHCAVVYGDNLKSLELFGKFMGFEVVVIK